ncbi:MAG: hypothetical protein OEL83_15900 [Desulforhopalus sp.]|nr:hypothetical protein [Desulforhopalus sp.]
MSGIAGIGFVGAFLSLVAAGLTVFIYIAILLNDEARVKCSPMPGTSSCAAGVIINIHRSFSERGDGIFPFLAWHSCVFLLVTSYFWDRLEEGAENGVLCTGDAGERNSEVIQCYYYDPRVCSAHNGGFIGLGFGTIAGVAAGVAIAAAIGCATIILCLLAILLAIIVAIVCAVLGAIIGGHIGKAAKEDELEEEHVDAATLNPGQLLTVWGNLANVGWNIFWFVEQTAIHDNAITEVNDPYSYCEIDEEPPLLVGIDGCSEIY